MYNKYFELKYKNRIDKIIKLHHTEHESIDNFKNSIKIIYKDNPTTKNYIKTQLKIFDIEYDDALKAFNTKYPKYAEYYEQYYNNKRAAFFQNPSELLKWFDNQENKCGYCKITQDDLKNIVKKRGGKLTLNHKTKRSKGTLEIEKEDPSGYYEFDNCILACPLCNNAKSNLIDVESWKDIFVPAMKEYYKKLLS